MKNNNLKQKSVTLFTILAIAVVVAMTAAAQTRATTKGSAPLTPRCTVRSLAGNFGLTVTAANIVPPSTTIPIVSVGLVNFDGAGSLSGGVTTSFGGFVGTDSITGNYTIESNCTGSFSVTFSNGFTINHNLVIVDEGKEVDFIQTDQGTVTTGRARRQ
jgi:hypothetical protein